MHLLALTTDENSAGIWIAAIGVVGLFITSLSGIVLAVLNRKQSSRENAKTQGDVQQIHVIVNAERTAMKAEQAALQERIVNLEKLLASHRGVDAAGAATAATLLEKAAVSAAELLAGAAARKREEVRGEGLAQAPLAAALSANTSATAANTAALDNPPREN